MENSRRFLIFLGFLVATVAMVGSLYFSEARLFSPCTYCWYQRILMYPLVPILGIATIRNDRWVALYALPLTVIGMGYGLFQYGLQKGLVPSENGCAALCDHSWINWFGFITIPFLSLSAFVLITILMVTVLLKRQPTVQ